MYIISSTFSYLFILMGRVNQAAVGFSIFFASSDVFSFTSFAELCNTDYFIYVHFLVLGLLHLSYIHT